MPIETEVARSPGWWLRRLFNMLADRRRRARLQLLLDYHRGHAPLPQGAENAREAFEAFQKKARSNFAELIVSVMSERMAPVGFRTALDDDSTGDAEVGSLWQRAGLDVASADVHDFMLALGEAFVIVGPMDEEIGAPLVTCEDPRFMVADVDPANPRRILAALKVLYDDAEQEDRAYLFLPGEVHVAVRRAHTAELQRAVAPPPANLPHHPKGRLGALTSFDPKSWEWSPERSGELPHSRIPVVRFENKYGLGEFETHTDLLDRINHQILQRMVIATMQAFRQRAVKGLPMVYPEDHPLAGQEIDYNTIFAADPAALWLLPETADIWESQTNDLRPILDAVEDDLQHLAAVTRTPMFMLSPGGENQSAEGASLAREGLVFKVSDRITRTSHPWAQVMSLTLLHAGQSERADLAKLQTIWAPPNRLSLSERADAASKLKDILPRRTLLIDVLGMAPADADRTMTEITEEQLLNAQVAAAVAAAAVAAANPQAQQQGANGEPGGQQQPAAGGQQPQQGTPPEGVS